MADFEINGMATLRRELATLPDKVARKAAHAGTVKAAAYMRKQVRSKLGSIKSLQFDGKKYRTIKYIRTYRMKRPTSNGHGVSSLVYVSNSVMRVFEQGRRDYQRPRRSGNWVAGSPEMKRFAFWHSTIRTHARPAVQVMIDHTRTALVKESVDIYRKTLRGK